MTRPKDVLKREVARRVGRGWHVAYQDSDTAVLLKPGPPPAPTTVHVILVLLTCGLWFVPWVLIEWGRRNGFGDSRVVITVSEDLHVHTSKTR